MHSYLLILKRFELLYTKGKQNERLEETLHDPSFT